MTGRKRFAIPLLLLATAAATTARDGVPRDDPAPAGAARDPALLEAAMLSGHNAARAALGLPPLVWDGRLVASARVHAETMARTGHYAHAVQPMDRTRQGENLWLGQRGTYSYDAMVGIWLDERRNFVDQPTPAFSRTGRWQDAAHYAQIVWRGTTTLGCAMASSATDDYLVCRYAPPGNVTGQRAF